MDKMLGVFIRRWKPKRVANDRNDSPGTDGSVSPEPPDRPPLKAPPSRQIHPVYEDKSHILAYEGSLGRKNSKAPSTLPLSEDSNQNYPDTPVYPLTPNICVEGGKIEFIKTPPESARSSIATPPSSPLSSARAGRGFHEGGEKFDGDKELLEKRVRQLEYQLEEEKRRTQKERMTVAKLQNKLAKREGQAQRDAERERRARGDSEARARTAEADAARHHAKLLAAQREIARMEETVRTLLQYKTRAEVLKQEKSSLSAALEARSAHYQTTLSRVTAENEALRAQLSAALAPSNAAPPDRAHYERCLDDVAHQVVRALLSQKGLREELGSVRGRVRELEAQNRALSALLLRQLRPQVRPSPASPEQHSDPQVYILNSSSPTTDAPPTLHSSPGSLPPPTEAATLRRSGSLVSFADSLEPRLSLDDKRRHRILTDLWGELRAFEVTPQSLARALGAVDPALWAPPERPITLNLNVTPPAVLGRTGANRRSKLAEAAQVVNKSAEEEVAAETPESGNKDEGYSTMSSDVQVDSSRQGEHNRELEDLKEASDETDNQTIISMGNKETRIIVLEDASNPENVLFFPVNVAVSVNTRNSYPPSRNVLPFQHIMRSFSDSHLCLKLTTSTTPCGENCFSISTPISSTPSMFIFDLKPFINQERTCINPLRRTRATTSLIKSNSGIEQMDQKSNRSSWVSNMDEQADGSQYDAEYVQHWLKLDDTRSALQQQHRDLLELEYDHAELEDWSLSLSCEDLQDANWRRNSPYSEITTPGQISLSTLPSIQENNALELEEDVSECLWNNSSYMVDRPNGKMDTLQDNENDDELKALEKNWPYLGQQHSEIPSPGGSWSSVNDSEDCLNNECFYGNEATQERAASKRSSAALSGCSDEADSPAVGTDFTRDFYRLVKYESTKSLASNSSRGLGVGNAPDNNGSHLRIQEVQEVPNQEREHALQNVLNFIAEQQKYCHDREELDSIPSRPTSEILELPPPDIDLPNDGIDVMDSQEDYDHTPYSRDGFRNSSYSRDVILSESESCDIIIDNQLSSRYNDVSPDLKKVPRIIDNGEDIFSDDNNYYSFKHIENVENEIDKQHLLKVHQKNEINKCIDISSTNNVIVSSFPNEDGIRLTIVDPQHPEDLNKPFSASDLNGIDARVTSQSENNICLRTKQNKFCNSDRMSFANPDSTFPKSASLPSNYPETETSLMEEVLSACRRSSSILVPVPEEEESANENGSPQMTESNTTSTSTTETVVVGAVKERKSGSERSRIPMLMGSKRPPYSPSRTRSRIPVAESNKSSFANSIITSETPIRPSSASLLPGKVIVHQGPGKGQTLSFHEAATSKDVIDELNRMIYKETGSNLECEPEVAMASSGIEGCSSKDGAYWCPTGWVHVEKDIDFSDPKARANLLDVMLASSDSSTSPTSSCGGSTFSGDSGDEPVSSAAADYSKLHRLHRYRRQKKAAALRNKGMAVLRFSCYRRPSIIGRDDFFVRYGRQEQEAVASFDFLEEFSSANASMNSSVDEARTKHALNGLLSQDQAKSLFAEQRANKQNEGEQNPAAIRDSVSRSGPDIEYDGHAP